MARSRAARVRRLAAGRGVAGRGLTVLEIMIVIAIVGMLAYLGYSGFRTLSSAALVEDTNDLGGVMRRAPVLALEGGVPVRIVLDVDQQTYWVEACVGDPTLTRSDEEQASDADTVAKELAKAQDRLSTLPAGQLKADTPEQAAAFAQALAGQAVGGRICYPIDKLPSELAQLGKVWSGDSTGRELRRKLQTGRDVKFKEIWVQHLEDSVTSGRVSITFFPSGRAEKAIVTLGDGRSTHSIYLHGLTARVEIIDGAPRDPEDHLMRNAKGEEDAER